MSQSASAAVTKHHRQSGLNNKIYFLIVWDIGKSKVKVMPDFVTGEGSLLGLQVATFWLCPHMAQDTLSGVSHKNTNPVGSGPHP